MIPVRLRALLASLLIGLTATACGASPGLSTREAEASSRLQEMTFPAIVQSVERYRLKRATVGGSPYDRADRLVPFSEPPESYDACNDDESEIEAFWEQNRPYITCFLPARKLRQGHYSRFFRVVGDKGERGALLNDTLMFLKSSALSGRKTFVIHDDGLLVNKRGQGVWILRMTTDQQAIAYAVWLLNDGTLEGVEWTLPVAE